jgi:Flp pilus assembly protein TadG
VNRVRQGTTAIEFAFILTAFTALFFGIMDWGWMFYQRSNVMEAVLEACREGVTVSQSATPGPTSVATSTVEEILTEYGFDPDDADILVTTEGSTPDEVLVVSVSVPFDPLLGLVPVPEDLGVEMSMYLELQD